MKKDQLSTKGSRIMTDEEFREEVEQAVALYERANGHAATRTRTMISEHGEIEALSRLMLNPDLQQGFRVLRDKKRLDKTFEAVILRNKDKFREEVVQVAQWQLLQRQKQ